MVVRLYYDVAMGARYFAAGASLEKIFFQKSRIEFSSTLSS